MDRMSQNQQRCSVSYRQTDDRFQKTAVDMLGRNQQMVQGEVLTDNGHIVHCQVLTGSRQYVGNNSGHINTEPTDSTV